MPEINKTYGDAGHDHFYSVAPIRRSIDTGGGGWVEAVNGTGVVAVAHRSYALTSGATANGDALARMQQESGFSRGARFDVIDFDRKIVLHTRFTVSVGTTAGVCRISLGKSHGDGIGTLANKGFGFKVANLLLVSFVHDGTDFAQTATAETLTATTIYDLRIESMGNGIVNFYLDDVAVSQETGGPTGLGTADDDCFQVETDNNTDNAVQACAFWDVFYEDVG